MALTISQACRDKIVEFEVGSRAYYEKYAKHPVWPGGASGVTIGIGYDLGQHTVQQFIDDWSGYTAVNACPELQAVCRHSGANAKWLLHTVAGISIPYDAAVAVFDKIVLPRYIAMTDRTFPNCSQLPQDAFGALVDLVFNRGGDVGMDDRRAEMRAIKNAMLAQNISVIPSLIRSMKRLWPTNLALLGRRDWEADFFERAILLGNFVPRAPVVQGPVVRPPVTHLQTPVLPAARPRAPAQRDLRDTSSDVLNEQELERIRRTNR